VLNADFRYAWLGVQYRAAVAASVTLLARLESQSDTAVTALASGGGIKSASGNGKAMEYFGPSESGISPTELGELTGQMLRLYAQSVEALGGTPTDAAIYAEMLYRIDPVTEVGPSSFVSLRCA